MGLRAMRGNALRPASVVAKTLNVTSLLFDVAAALRL
jgi:hypothetical protein